MKVMEGEAAKARRKQLCDEAYRFGNEYWNVNEKHPALRLFAAKYGKAFLRAGCTLMQGLSADPRFEIVMAKETGGYTVIVKDSSEPA